MKRFDDPCYRVEGIGECGAVWHVRLAKSRQIGRDDVPTIRELRDQVAKHMAGCWKSVQQEQRLSCFRPCLAVENVEAVDVGSLIGDVAHGFGPPLVAPGHDAAVDVPDSASHPARGGGEKERNGVRQVARRAYPAERMEGVEAVQGLF